MAVRKWIAAFLLIVMPGTCFALGGASPPDPYQLRANGASDNFQGFSWKVTAGLTLRNNAINPAKKTLILFGPGQSNGTNVIPTLYTPTNTAVIDQLNVYDGSLYSIGGPLLGSTGPQSTVTSQGNIFAMVADKAIPTFDRVIIVSLAIGSTTVADWATGDLSNRIQVAMLRLAARGITPSTTGTTWALIFMQGEGDNGATTQAAWTASFGTFKTNILATGFNGRIFQPQETMNGGVTDTNIRAAQAAVVDSVTVYSAGDLDTLTGLTNRQTGLTHFNDTGGPAAATILWNAMHASGAPF